MRVLFIHHGQVLGGAPVSLLNTILGLKKKSAIEIKVLCAHANMKNFFKENAQIDVGDIYNPGLIFGRVFIGWASMLRLETCRRTLYELLVLPLSVFRQYKQIKEEKPDIVHLNSSILFSTAIAVKLAKIKLVWHIRETLIGGGLNLRRIAIGWFIRKLSDKVIAISPFDAESLGRDRSDKVEVVYNFVDFERFNFEKFNSTVEKKKLGVSETEKLIISLGGVSFRKGAFQLIEAMKYVSDDIKLIFAGPKVDVHSYQEISLKIRVMLCVEDVLIKTGCKKAYTWYYCYRIIKAVNKIEKNKISFIGEVSDVVPLLVACDILVFAGTTPHFPRPVYEAWAMKKPVVVFDMDGICQNIDDGVDGVIVKKLTGEALGKAINSLLKNKHKMCSMGEYGYKKSRERFEQNKNILKILNIYKELLHDV